MIEFCHNLTFKVFSQFRFLSFVSSVQSLVWKSGRLYTRLIGWLVGCCHTFVRWSVGQLGNLRIRGGGIFGDLCSFAHFRHHAAHFWNHAAHLWHHAAHFWHNAAHFWHHTTNFWDHAAYFWHHVAHFWQHAAHAGNRPLFWTLYLLYLMLACENVSFLAIRSQGKEQLKDVRAVRDVNCIVKVCIIQIAFCYLTK